MSQKKPPKKSSGDPLTRPDGRSLPPSRQGKKPITAYVDPQTHKRLRLMGGELEKSNQEMIIEALEDYLEKQTAKR